MAAAGITTATTTSMILTTPKVGRRQVNRRPEHSPRGTAAAGNGRVAPEGAAYREDYLPDRGPDLDEALDGTESGHEP